MRLLLHARMAAPHRAGHWMALTLPDADAEVIWSPGVCLLLSCSITVLDAVLQSGLRA